MDMTRHLLSVNNHILLDQNNEIPWQSDLSWVRGGGLAMSDLLPGLRHFETALIPPFVSPDHATCNGGQDVKHTLGKIPVWWETPYQMYKQDEGKCLPPWDMQLYSLQAHHAKSETVFSSPIISPVNIMLTAPYARSRALAVGYVCIYHVEDLFFTTQVSGKQKALTTFFLSCLFTFFHCPTGLAAYIHYCSLYFLFLTLVSI